MARMRLGMPTIVMVAAVCLPMIGSNNTRLSKKRMQRLLREFAISTEWGVRDG